MKKIVLVAGGTAGHIFPAIGVYRTLIRAGYEVSFITDERCEKYLIQNNITNYQKYIFGGNKSGLKNKIKLAFKMLGYYFKSASHIKNYKPDAIIGFGGYSSFPYMLAATNNKRGRHVAIHEQNAVLGKANSKLVNAWYSGKVDAIFTSFSSTIGLDKDNKKLFITGCPVREEMLSIANLDYPSLEESLNILVVGGSLGAKSFDDIIPQIIEDIPEEVRQHIRITQQSKDESLQQRYADMGVQATIAPFFDNMPELMAETHFMICRAGASTIFEAMVANKPAIYIPLENSALNHQEENANIISSENLGWKCNEKDIKPDVIATHIIRLIAEPELLTEMSDRIYALQSALYNLNLATLITGLVEQ